MIPKVEACLETLERGVHKVHIIDGRLRHSLLLEIYTTQGWGRRFSATRVEATTRASYDHAARDRCERVRLNRPAAVVCLLGFRLVRALRPCHARKECMMASIESTQFRSNGCPVPAST